MSLEERDAEILRRRAKGEGATAIARELDCPKAAVYRVWKRHPQPPQTAVYRCDGCGRAVKAPAGQESVECPHCDNRAWRPMSDAEVKRRLAAAVAQLEGK